MERYRSAGFDVRSLEDVGAAIAPRVADDNAVVRGKPRGLAVQLRNRYRFRGRLATEVEQLLYEVFAPLVHNAAVYGFRAGAPDDRRQALWVLAAAVSSGPDERELALADPVAKLAYGLARAKAGRRMLTGLRPVFGEFNNWYATQVCQWSYWTYRERHTREQRDLGGEEAGRLIPADARDA